MANKLREKDNDMTENDVVRKLKKIDGVTKIKISSKNYMYKGVEFSYQGGEFLAWLLDARADMVAVKRPGTGIEPGKMDLVIGKKAKADIS